MIYTKLTYGYVAQSIDSDTGDCVQMQFIPDGRVERLGDDGTPIVDGASVELENTEKETALDMVQP